MFEHISHVSFALYLCTYGFVHLRAQLVLYAHLSLWEFLKSMCDCCKLIFKLVMNDWSIVLMVLIHAQTYVYISFHSFILCFCFITQQMSNSKRDNELQKPLHILVFEQEKGKATYIEMYGAQKAKGLLIKMKYKKFQALISKRDVKIKND